MRFDVYVQRKNFQKSVHPHHGVVGELPRGEGIAARAVTIEVPNVSFESDPFPPWRVFGFRRMERIWRREGGKRGSVRLRRWKVGRRNRGDLGRQGLLTLTGEALGTLAAPEHSRRRVAFRPVSE